MKTIKITTFLGTAIVILSSFILLASCTSGIGTITDGPRQTNTSETTTAQTEPSVTPTHTSSTTTTATTTETATPTTTTTTATATTQTATTTTTTTTVTTTAVEPKDVLIPVVGAEFPQVKTEYDKWTILEFDYDVIHEPGDDYHFPWSLTVKNKTETDLELTAYIIHWGFHGWVGYVSEMPFTLKAGETMSLSGEDILGEVFYEEMIYLEDVQIEIYIAEG